MKNNDNTRVPGMTKPVDFGTVDDENREEYLQNQKNVIANLEDIPMNMKPLAD